jgi:transcriptional regulator with XRE-family HTH domain
MDEKRFGSAIRAARLRAAWRQVDLAAAARVSRATVSRIERGLIDDVGFGTLRRVAAALDVRVELLTRTRGADLDRLLNAKHSGLAEAVVRMLAGVGGWAVRPEVSFSEFGERGIVDLVARHNAQGAVLVIELKTDIIDVGELLGTLNRKRRLGPVIARGLGWQTTSVSTCLIVAEGTTNRRLVLAHAATFRAALPDDGRRARAWLRNPVGPLHATCFVSDARPRSVRSGFATVRRVSSHRTAAGASKTR